MANALQLTGGSVLKGLESHTKERKVIRITDIARKESNMADKVQKIKEWISKEQNGLMDAQGNFEYPEHEGAYNILCNLDAYIDSLQEEPVSEDLEEASRNYADDEEYGDDVYFAIKASFKAGAKWQEKQDQKTIELAEDHAMLAGMEKMKEEMMANIWKPADGDDLPEYDREVIAILDYDFGHYKVVYAHRPNPDGWNGTNIDTGEKEHFEPVIYDKGGWNQPHVLYWLDAKLPYEENKISK